MLDRTALVITAWKRPDYLKRTLESWAMTPELIELRGIIVALGWSHRYDDMVDTITTSARMLMRQPVVLRDSPEAAQSPGMHRALGEAIDTAFLDREVDWVLLGEEDVVVSTDALAYVSWAQQEVRERTLCICLHNQGGCGWDGLTAEREDGDADQAAVHRAAYFNPWGWCIRRDMWKQVARPAWDWDCTIPGGPGSGYDWGMQRLMDTEPWHSLVPDAARSQTIGELFGVNSNPDIFPLQQAKSFRRQREMPVPYRLVS